MSLIFEHPLHAAPLSSPTALARRLHMAHVFLACVYLFTIPLHTMPKDITFILLLLLATIRIPHTWACYRTVLAAPTLLLLYLWALWQAVALLWSDDLAAGVEELRAFRFVLTPFVLWPVIQHAPRLIGSFLVGVFVVNVVQLGQELRVFGLNPDVNDRLRGLLHPIQTGQICLTAMCWHLAAFLSAGVKVNARSRRSSAHRRARIFEVLSLAGFIISATGLVYTGSRGPWLAAAVATPLLVLVTAIRRRHSAGFLYRAALVLVVALAAAPAGYMFGRGFVTERIEEATRQFNAAREGDYSTDVGLRYGNWIWAWRFYTNAPILGIGPGDYREAVMTTPEYEGLVAREPNEARSFARAHPHSTYLYTLACSGTIGGIILASLMILVIRRAWLDPSDHVYVDGTLFAIVAWLVGAQFDAYQLAGTLFAVFGFFVALTLPHRPAAIVTHPLAPIMPRP